MTKPKIVTRNPENKLAELRDFLKDYRAALEENADRMVNSIIDHIYDAVIKDPVKYLSNSWVTITIQNIDDNLTGPAQYSIAEDYQPVCLSDYKFNTTEITSGANAVSADALAHAFYRKTSLFRCYSILHVVEVNDVEESSQKLLVVQLDLDSLDMLEATTVGPVD